MEFRNKFTSLMSIIALFVSYVVMFPVYVAVWTNNLLRTSTIIIDIIILSVFLLIFSLFVIYWIHHQIEKMSNNDEKPLNINVNEKTDIP